MTDTTHELSILARASDVSVSSTFRMMGTDGIAEWVR